MSKLFARLLNDESAAAAIEYGLIAAGISLPINAVVNGLGTSLNTKFADIDKWSSYSLLTTSIARSTNDR